MGKNLYETPRDMNKWHTQKESHDHSHVPSQNEKKARIDELKRIRKINKGSYVVF